LDDRENFLRRDGFAFRQKPSQDIIHEFQSFVLGGMQDLQVLLDRCGLTGSREQLVVGHPKSGCRIQMVDVLVVGEGARLADQRIDHVAKVDPLLALPEQSRQAFQALVAIPEFEMVLVDQHVHFQPDILAADRIGVSLDTQDAIRLDRDTHRRRCAEPLVRQRFQGFAFFSEDAGARVVTPRNDLPDESQVLIFVGEVAIATQSQRLIEPGFQMSMSRLNVAVFMRLADIDTMTSDPIMTEQPLVLCRELLVAGKVVDRRRKTVAADSPRDATSEVQGVLKTRRQRLERLRVAEVYVLPVGIREDRVEQHVVVRSSLNGDLQSVQNDEVEGDHVPRMMDLGELDFLLNSVLKLPLLNAPLQRPSNRIGDPHFGLVVVFLFQPIEQGKGSQLGILFQEFLDLWPEWLEWILPSPILAWSPLPLAGKYSGVAIVSNCPLTHLQPPCNSSY